MLKNIFLLVNCLHSAAGLRFNNALSSWAEKKEDLLFIVPVGPKSVELIKQDINYLRTNYTGRVDVVLLHYDKLKDTWASKAGVNWYSKNVQVSFEEAGGKFNLLQKYFQSRTEDMYKYDWIWAMDEDFDITQMNIQSMIGTATESGSKIVSPAVRFPSENSSLTNLEKGSSEVGCRNGNPSCKFQSGNDGCKYSHVNFLEVMMPMFRPDALKKILFECDHCIHEHSLWGLNSMWCKFVVDKFGMEDNMKGCTLLDQHRALKMVYHTLPTSYHSRSDELDVRAHNGKYWVKQNEWASQCVPLSSRRAQ